MPSVPTLTLFAGAAFVVLVVPGPAVLYIVTRGASQGRRAALTSVAGIHVGTLVHIFAAALGLSALLVASATAFTVVKLAGAAYLVALGIATIRAGRRAAGSAASAPPRSTRRIFTDGLVLNILNPKTAVFFLAFVPQFVDVDAGQTTLQLLVFGATFVAIGLVTDGAYALAAGWVGRRLHGSTTAERRKQVASGSAYIGLGVLTAVSGASTSG